MQARESLLFPGGGLAENFVRPMKNGTFLGDTVEEAKGEMGKWLAAHREVTIRKEYAPIEMPPVPGEARTAIIRIEFEESIQGITEES